MGCLDGNNRWFSFLVTLSQIAGITAVVLVGVWMGNFQGGFGWGYKNPHKFNYHPLFMVLGMVFLYGDAILVYRVFSKEKKLLIKMLHAVMQLAAFGFAVTGLVAVFSSHNEAGFANLYSIHSWVGIATVTMFAMQFLLGFLMYLCPVFNDWTKSWYMSVHRFWGLAIFCMAIATALMGVVENTGFKYSKDYNKRQPQGYVINFIGVCLVVFGWIVVFVATKPEYKRPSEEPEYSSQFDDN